MAGSLKMEAWRVLDGESAVLDAARAVTRILRESRIRGAVVGGIAVGLHGHVRATLDVDVYVPEPLEDFGAALRAAGCTFNSRRREFRLGAVPIHIVTDDQTGGPPGRITTIDGIQTVGLADLINMKLRSGLESIVRAQDLADVIALIRICKLTAAFVAKLDRSLRPEFRKLVTAVRREA